MLKTNPHIHNLITVDTSGGWKELKAIKEQLKNREYNLIVDIHKNFRSVYLKTGLLCKKVTYKKYALKRFLLVRFGWNLYHKVIPISQRYINSLSRFGIVYDLMGLEFYPDQKIQKETDILLADQGLTKNKLTICIAPGAGFETKRWPVQYYIHLAQKFSTELKSQILLLGNEQDQNLTREIKEQVTGKSLDLAGQLSIMETACAMNHADMVITNDTGLMHLATALNKKTVAIFGPTTRELGFFPSSPLCRVIENKNLKCRPCTHIGSKKCPKGHFKCMKDIEPEHVFKIAKKLLNM